MLYVIRLTGIIKCMHKTLKGLYILCKTKVRNVHIIGYKDFWKSIWHASTFNVVEANLLRSITCCRNHTPDILPANHYRTWRMGFMYVIVQTAFNFAVSVNTQFRSFMKTPQLSCLVMVAFCDG